MCIRDSVKTCSDPFRSSSELLSFRFKEISVICVFVCVCTYCKITGLNTLHLQKQILIGSFNKFIDYFFFYIKDIQFCMKIISLKLKRVFNCCIDIKSLYNSTFLDLLDYVGSVRTISWSCSCFYVRRCPHKEECRSQGFLVGCLLYTSRCV